MKLNRCVIAIVAAMPVVLAHAAVVYQFECEPAAVDLAPGQTGQVAVSLVERLTDGSGSLLEARGGLGSFDLALAPGGTATDPAQLTGVLLDGRFDSAFNIVLPMAVIAGCDPLGPAGAAGAADGQTRRVGLAVFSVTAGAVVGETTIVTVGDYDTPEPGSFNSTFYWDDLEAAEPLDGAIAPAAFAVTVVPEPATALLLAAAAAAITAGKR
ncbi:MAG: PEP-CTERM sorting domain-containing protein [Planctomycetes bacterium]|nr:PEP-CTERM sorting domain-containing protein [Planctomycetota bacterium]